MLVAATPLAAQQQSENHVIEGATIYGGVSPAAIDLGSSGFRVTFSAMGEPMATEATSAGAGHVVDSGFVSAYSPPSEVTEVVFADARTLAWQGVRSAASYVVYRGSLAGLPSAYGSCLQAGIPATSTDEPSMPAAGEAYAYLVTARNTLDEEGGAGSDSARNPRALAVCP